MSRSPVRSAVPLDAVRHRVAQAAALIFDVDGTLAETEELHREAFNAAFAELKLDWHWDQRVYKDLLRTAGGKERIRSFGMTQRNRPPLSDRAIADLHRIKTDKFAALMTEAKCPLRQGVRTMLEQARARGQRLAIATTTTRDNIGALLSVALDPAWESWFAAVVAGDDVPRKKPFPDIYLAVLSELELDGAACLALEDSANGLLSATRAGVPCLITRSIYFRDDDFTGALAVIDDLAELDA
jgi:HAD superfamily hydrolase (TIGR01509 family)